MTRIVPPRLLHLLTAAMMFVVLHGIWTPNASAKAKKKKWSIEQPNVASRTVKIDTRTGTWMNLDVSPDGKTIVFDLLGDLYLLPIQGGVAKPLTQGLAWDMQPKFDPTGRWVAFTSDRAGGDNLWIIKTDGTGARAITKESYRLLSAPDWSPDGRSIVGRKHFTSRRSIGAGEMWLYHLKGGSGVQMTTRATPQKDEGEPVFSADGRYLYYSRDVTPGKRFEYNKDASKGIYAIERLNRRTGEIKRIISGPGGAIRPTPSPDGKSLAFVRRDQGRSALYLRTLKSGKERRLASHLERDLQESWAIHGVYPSMAWTPDGKSVVFWKGGKIHRVDIKTRAVTEIPFHVKSTRRILEPVRFPVEVAPDRFPVKMLRWVTVSPNGEEVVFQALGYLYVRSLKTGKLRRLTRQTAHFEFYPSFTADGKHVIYSTWSDTAFGHIRKADLKKGRSRKLTQEPGHYIAPTLSVDGKHLAYQRVPGGWLTSPLWTTKKGLFVRDLKTGKETLIARSGQRPQFTKKTGYVTFWERGPKDVRTLYRARVDGKGRVALATSKSATAFKLSDDEKWLTFVEGNRVYLTPWTNAGKVRRIGPKDRSFPTKRMSDGSGLNPHFAKNNGRIYWQLGSTLYSTDVYYQFHPHTQVKRVTPLAAKIGFTAPSSKPQGVVAIVGARIITMKGDQVIEDGTILVRDNRIIRVGPKAYVTVPKGAFRIDAKGLTAMPGIVDVHAHGAQAEYGITPQDNWLHHATLAFGVTTIHDPSNRSESVFAAGEMVKAGRVVGPRIYSTGTILYGASGSYRADIQSLKDAFDHVGRQQAMGAVTVKSYNQPRRNQRQQVLAAARKLKMMVMPEGGALFQHNMSMIADGHTGIEHAIPLARGYDDVLQFWAGAGVGYTPTFNVAYGGLKGENYWYQERPIYKHKRLLRFVPRRWLDARARRPAKAPHHEWNHIDVARFAKRLVDAGVKVQVGGHGQREGLGAHWEIWSMSQGGFTPLQALRAATLHGAYYIGMEKDIGSLEHGKVADIILIDGNPLKDIRRTEHVKYTMINGRVFKADTMAQVYPSARPAPQFFFSKGAGSGAVNLELGHSHGCPVCEH